MRQRHGAERAGASAASVGQQLLAFARVQPPRPIGPSPGGTRLQRDAPAAKSGPRCCPQGPTLSGVSGM